MSVWARAGGGGWHGANALTGRRMGRSGMGEGAGFFGAAFRGGIIDATWERPSDGQEGRALSDLRARMTFFLLHSSLSKPLITATSSERRCSTRHLPTLWSPRLRRRCRSSNFLPSSSSALDSSAASLVGFSSSNLDLCDGGAYEGHPQDGREGNWQLTLSWLSLEAVGIRNHGRALRRPTPHSTLVGELTSPMLRVWRS